MRKIILTITIAFVLVTAILLIYKSVTTTSKTDSNIVFMESFHVFESFEMKKEYDVLLEKAISGDRMLLDSLGRSLNALSSNKNISEETLNKSKMNYLQYKEAYDAKFGELSSKYTEQVYDRLNQYIKDFGKHHKYSLILGASGEGNVMYVDDKTDITNELIEFINAKYQDK